MGKQISCKWPFTFLCTTLLHPPVSMQLSPLYLSLSLLSVSLSCSVFHSSHRKMTSPVKEDERKKKRKEQDGRQDAG